MNNKRQTKRRNERPRRAELELELKSKLKPKRKTETKTKTQNKTETESESESESESGTGTKTETGNEMEIEIQIQIETETIPTTIDKLQTCYLSPYHCQFALVSCRQHGYVLLHPRLPDHHTGSRQRIQLYNKRFCRHPLIVRHVQRVRSI